MYEVKIKLNTIDDVKELVSDVTAFPCGFEIISERYIIDAKSLIGIFSLDLSKTLTLVIKSDDDKEIDYVMKSIDKFVVRE